MNIWRLKPRLARTLGDFEVLRVIRNSCRLDLTGYTDEITEEQQMKYFLRHDMKKVRHYIYSLDGKDVGFSRLEWREGFIIPTVGLVPEARGKGLGRELVKLYLLAAGGPLIGNMLLSNTAIVKINYSLGWRPVGPPVDGIQTLECDWPPPFLRTPEEFEALRTNYPQEVYDEIVRYHGYGDKT